MAPPLYMIIVRFMAGLVIAVAGFVGANHGSTQRVEFIAGLSAVIATYIAAFIDRSAGQHDSESKSEDNALLQEFIMASGFNEKDAIRVLKTNREFVEETIARWKKK